MWLSRVFTKNMLCVIQLHFFAWFPGPILKPKNRPTLLQKHTQKWTELILEKLISNDGFCPWYFESELSRPNWVVGQEWLLGYCTLGCINFHRFSSASFKIKWLNFKIAILKNGHFWSFNVGTRLKNFRSTCFKILGKVRTLTHIKPHSYPWPTVFHNLIKVKQKKTLFDIY